MNKIRRPSITTVILGVLLLSLVVGGVLVVRLIDRLSETDLQKRREDLQSRMLGFRADLAGNLFKAMSESHPGPPSLLFDDTVRDELGEQFMRNSKQSRESQLVSGLALGMRTERGEIRFERFDPETRTFKQAKWPNEIAELQAELQPEKPDQGANGNRRRGLGFLLNGEAPMIALPLISDEMRRGRAPTATARQLRAERTREDVWDGPFRPGADQPGERAPWSRREWEPGRRPGPGFPPALPDSFGQRPFGFPPRPAPDRMSPRMVGWCFLILDYQKLKMEVLPQVINRHFGSRARDFGLAVFSPPGIRAIVDSGMPADLTASTRVDAAVSLIERRPPPTYPRLSPAASTPPQREIAESAMLGEVLKPQTDGWVLVARHRSGSIEAVVASNRRRSIALALGFIGLLGTTATLLVWSSRRSRDLARRQMEFVAGVSHELLTPISVIRTAASNLSRGVINNSDKALEYGKTLEKESKRLTKMIEQVLSFAALQSGTGGSPTEPVDLTPLLRDIVSEYRVSLGEKGWEVCDEIEPVGKVVIEPRALQSCLYNLIDNAGKYAQSGRWLRLTASRQRLKSKAVVRITVEDHGPGITPEDLPHIFKPFYRGRGFAASNLPGAGLGLSIVKQQLSRLGGQLTVVSSADGSVFSLVLPAAD